MTYGAMFYNGRTNRQRRRIPGRVLVKLLAFGIAEVIRRIVT